MASEKGKRVDAREQEQWGSSLSPAPCIFSRSPAPCRTAPPTKGLEQACFRRLNYYSNYLEGLNRE